MSGSLEDYSRPMLSFGILLLSVVMILRSSSQAKKNPPRSNVEREHLRSRLVEAAENRRIEDQREKDVKGTREPTTRPSKEKPTPDTPKAPRQATQAEEFKYREEKLSQQQFGFSIYGNTDYCFDCVSTAPVTSSRASGFGLGIHSIAVIPDLPGSAQVYRELERLRDEFDPIVKARGWKVLNLTEMCCCGDGDKSLPSSTASKRRQEQDDVLGYCVSPNDNRIAQGIHIRCRVANSCRDGLRLYPYAELVQTMVRSLRKTLFLLNQVGSHCSVMSLRILRLDLTTVGSFG